MAKRFTDTDKWKREWFCELSSRAKLVWFYLLDQCDHRGVWFRNFKLMSEQLGFKVSAGDLVTWFGSKITAFDGDKYFIPSFVDFQYGELKDSNNAHKPILRLLEYLKTCENLGPPQVLNSPSIGAQDKEEDKEKDKDPVFKTSTPEKIQDFGPRELALAWNERMSIAKRLNGKPMPLVDIERLRPDQERWKTAKARLEEEPRLEWWVDVFDRIARSEFCRGKGARGDWVASFDFAIRPKTAIAVMEDQYGCTPRRKITSAPTTPVHAPEHPELSPDERAKAAAHVKDLLAKAGNLGVRREGA